MSPLKITCATVLIVLVLAVPGLANPMTFQFVSIAQSRCPAPCVYPPSIFDMPGGNGASTGTFTFDRTLLAGGSGVGLFSLSDAGPLVVNVTGYGTLTVAHANLNGELNSVNENTFTFGGAIDQLPGIDMELYIVGQGPYFGCFGAFNCDFQVPTFTSIQPAIPLVAYIQIRTPGLSSFGAPVDVGLIDPDYLNGRLTSLVPIPIPEPTSWVLLSSGLMLTAFVRKMLTT